MAAALLLLALTFGASAVTGRELTRFLADLDRRALRQATEVFNSAVEQQRGYLQSQIGVLADDMRVRVTVMTPRFDEDTVRDVLEDLKKTSGASVLAVLDVGGRVKAVSGMDLLRGVEVGSSPVIRAALQGPAVDVWTFADQVLVIGVAPIRSGDRIAALVMMGFALGERLFGTVQTTTGVYGAAFTGDRLVLSTWKDANVTAALRQGATIPEGTDVVVPQGVQFLARTNRTSDAPTAAKLVWVVPQQLGGHRARFLRATMSWLPLCAALLAILVMPLVARRRAQGGAP